MLSFFTAILTSVLWLAGVGFWISAKLADVAISSLALNEIAVYGLIILLPISATEMGTVAAATFINPSFIIIPPNNSYII